jgi:thiosulfate/3-mercaptopyruvate sulfurtransferase
MIKPIISVEELKKIKNNVLIFDVGNGAFALENYRKNHLENAVFIDVNIHLSKIVEDPANGGRHPLPKVSDFIKNLQNFGIDSSKHIVLYDINFGANAAARFWWMLRSIGHEKVQVLDGGLQAAQQEGFTITNKIKKILPSKIVLENYHKNWNLPLVTILEVEKYSKNLKKTIVDVREFGRYNGDYEPIDLIAGHIPNAINIPFQNNLDGNGKFLTQEKLKEMYQKYFEEIESENFMIHCGSGVTACHTILALDYAGFKIPSLYVGSWSEWSRNFK